MSFFASFLRLFHGVLISFDGSSLNSGLFRAYSIQALPIR